MAIFNSYVSHYQRVLADMSKLTDLSELISDQLRSKIECTGEGIALGLPYFGLQD
jgi:hypothetical protein